MRQYTRETTFVTSCLHNESILIDVYSIREEFAPLGSKFFPFRVDPFSGGENLTALPPLKVYPFPLNLSPEKDIVVLTHY